MPEPLLSAGLIMAGYTAAATLSRPGSAVSREAAAVRSNATKIIEHVESSRALFGAKSALISEMLEMAAECAMPNWDGYGAQPVDPCALMQAQEIIRSLPEDLPMPDVGIEPDGCVSLDWMPTPERTLTLSAGSTKRLPYAWVEGSERGHAVANFANGQLSSRILDEIKRICADESSLRAA